MERPPQESLPAMPPMVAREAVEISTGNQSPCGLSCRLRSSSTMPGSTRQRRPATSMARMRLRYLEQSTTSEWPTVCPHCDVPPPRGSKRALGILHRPRRDDTDRLDLVVRGIGRIAPAREAVEPDVAGNLLAKPALEPLHHDRRHVKPLFTTSLHHGFGHAKPGDLM